MKDTVCKPNAGIEERARRAPVPRLLASRSFRGAECASVLVVFLAFASLGWAGVPGRWDGAYGGQRNAATMYEVGASGQSRYPGRDSRGQRNSDDRRGGADVSRRLDRAGRLIKDKRFEEAISILEPVCDQYPGVIAAAELLSMSYLGAERPQDAVNLLESRISENPDHFPFIKNLGYAYLDLGRRDKAVQAWSLILKNDEKHSGYYGTIAKLMQEAGLYEEAIETLRAGRRSEQHFGRYTLEIVRLQRILGRWRSAFREGILYLAAVNNPRIEQAGFVFDIFRENGKPVPLLAVVDSMAAVGNAHGGFFRMLHALLMVEAAEYDAASRYRDGEKGEAPSENEFFTFLSYLSKMQHEGSDSAFYAFFAKSLEAFLERYESSAKAPGVLLIAALYSRELANKSKPPDRNGLDYAISLADSAMRHPLGASYREKASYFRALVQLEDLYIPDKALETLDRVKWRSKDMVRMAEELKVRALLASGLWSFAEIRLKALSENADSTLAALGHYGLGRLYFLSGRYGEAVEGLSALAERYAWSEWANDALETAIMVKGAMGDGLGALDLYRAALTARSRGNLSEAVDSLETLGVRFPEAVLLPRAILLRAELKVLAGRDAEAEGDLVLLAEAYPIHELAPRALERLAELIERDRPAEAVARYREIIERYPEDAFLERVRNRYITLRKSLEGEWGDEGGS